MTQPNYLDDAYMRRTTGYTREQLVKLDMAGVDISEFFDGDPRDLYIPIEDEDRNTNG